jgi:hypothetical protein
MAWSARCRSIIESDDGPEVKTKYNDGASVADHKAGGILKESGWAIIVATSANVPTQYGLWRTYSVRISKKKQKKYQTDMQCSQKVVEIERKIRPDDSSTQFSMDVTWGIEMDTWGVIAHDRTRGILRNDMLQFAKQRLGQSKGCDWGPEPCVIFG